MPTYSNSKLSTFENCPLKYKYQYIDKIKVEGQDTIEAFMGSRVHEALEKLYRDLKVCKLNSLKELLAYFNEIWKKNWDDSIVIVKEGFTKKNYRKLGEKCVTEFYNRYKPFKEKVIGIETTDFISLDKEGKYKWHVRMDRLDDCGKGKYEIHDYKTSGYLPKQSKMDKDRQLALYSLWAKENIKDFKSVELVWHYLVFDKELKSKRTSEELKSLRKDTLEAVKKIEKATEFPAIKSGLCDWCEYQDICPKWKHKFKVEALKPKEFKKEEGVKLVDRYAELKVKEKALSEELETAKNEIVEYAKKFNIEVVFGSNNKATVSSKEDISFPSKSAPERQQLIKLLKKEGLWGEVEDLDIFALKRIVKDQEWDAKILKKLEKFEEKKTTEGVRLGKK